MRKDYLIQFLTLACIWTFVGILTIMSQSRISIFLLTLMLIAEIYFYYNAMQGWRNSNEGWKRTIISWAKEIEQLKMRQKQYV